MINRNLLPGQKQKNYSIFNNLGYVLKEMYGWNRLFFFSVILGFIPHLVGACAGTILPARMVSQLESGQPLEQILFTLVILSVVICLGNALWEMCIAYHDITVNSFIEHFRKKYYEKLMDMDYDFLEEQDRQDVMGQAAAAVNTGRGLRDFPRIITWAAVNGGMALIYGGLLLRVNPLLVLVVLFTVFVNLKLLGLARKKHGEHFKGLSRHARKTAYINQQAVMSVPGKDIRVYRMAEWFLEKYSESLKEMDNIYGRIHNWYLFRNVSDAFLTFFRNGFAYIYLIVQIVQGRVSASEFVFYIGLVNGLAQYFDFVLRQVMQYNNINASMCYIRECLSWEDRWNRGDGIGRDALEEMKKHPVKVELRDVSFCYPGSKNPTISHIDLTIEAGEKLALIGLNGAGKTTLTKLICGFYHPTEGSILVNGIPVEQFNREEYRQLVSVLFQDWTMMPGTVDENITSEDAGEIDREALGRSLSLAGFAERYQSLQHAGDTMMIKEVNENAIQFSGGEMQKMLFARALYKNAALMILDEPTAALDPIAEDEMYQNYCKATKNNTSVYISHRLSSTRFCDRIVLLEQGKITEEGTHVSLMEKGGKYAELYEMQSQYYANDI